MLILFYVMHAIKSMLFRFSDKETKTAGNLLLDFFAKRGRVRETKRFPDRNPQATWQFAGKPAQRAAAMQCQYFRRGKP